MQLNELPHIAYADLFRQLALLMKSGVTLNEAMHILSTEEPNAAYRAILCQMAEQMDDGTDFTTALESARCFPPHAIGLIRVAERVGRTEETLHSLAEYYETQHRITRSLQNALIFPATLMLMMFAVIVVLLSRVLPVFDEVYQSLGGSLTGITGSLLTLGNLLNEATPLIGIVIGSMLILGTLIALIPFTRNRIKQLVQLIRGDRGINRKLNNAQFAQAMSMVLASGLPIEEGMELAKELFVHSPSVLRRCNRCTQMLEDGTDLVTALRKNSILSASAAQMLSIGLRTGNADEVMQQIADRMWREAEESLELRVSKVESALVLVTSFLVGAILMAVMLPLINIMNAIG